MLLIHLICVQGAHTFLDGILADRETHELFINKMRFIFLELPSFHREEAECNTDFERWIIIMY